MWPKVYIVLLNWRQWKVSLVCLESVLRQHYPNYTVVFCDNNSPDGSLDRMREWAEGRLEAENDAPAPLQPLFQSPLPKPIGYRYYFEQTLVADKTLPGGERSPVIFINTGKNDGCAKGYNAGIRYALSQPDCEYVWILNNDTVIDPGALAHLVQAMRQDAGIGMAGSTVCYFDDPGVIQAKGGCTFNYWFCVGMPVGYRTPFHPRMFDEQIPQRLEYVMGASMLVSKRYIDEAGLMPEITFLYFEELSWACEGRGKFRFVHVPRSLVYHREGSATELTNTEMNYGNFSDFMLIRNRLVFTRHYKPQMMPTVVLGILGVFFQSIFLGRWKRAKMILSYNFWNLNHYR